MDSEFWHQRWHLNEIGFHESDGNSLLATHFDALSIPKNGRVLVPLCGKTRDIPWLLSRGYQVVGAELSQLAVEQLFSELGTDPQITDLGNIKRFSAPGLTLFVGDIFGLTRDMVGPIDAVFDRAALVALPEDMRGRYARHIVDLSHCAPQLLIIFEYDQTSMAGPPFSIGSDEIHRHYDGHFEPVILEDKDVSGGLKGRTEAKEVAWLLSPLIS